MVCLGFERRAAGCKAQTNPLSYGGTSSLNILVEMFRFIFQLDNFLFSSFVFVATKLSFVSFIVFSRHFF